MRIMDAGWAAVIGAAVGASASILTSVLLTIPGLSPEDRANRIQRANRLNALVVEVSEHFTAIGEAPDSPNGHEEILGASRLLLRDRVELASLVGSKGDQLMSLFDVCLNGISKRAYKLGIDSASTFSTGAADWLRHGKLHRLSAKALEDLRLKIVAAKKRANDGEVESS
jgi:hypothetical protein